MGLSKQNTSVVYSRPSYEDNQLLINDDLRDFLLNDNLFSPAYIMKNLTFLKWLEANGLPCTLDYMSKYIEHRDLIKQYVSPATVKARKYHMKKICQELIRMNPDRWTMLEQFRLDAFFKNINTGSLQRQAIPEAKILTEKEISLLLKSATKEWQLILLFLATTGVRVSELVSIIRLRCVVTRNEVVITVTGKGGKQRIVVCGLNLYNAITKTFPSKYLLFCTKNGTKFHRSHIWRGCQRLGERVLGKTVGVHTFRHSFATQMINKGVDLKRVSEFLGHSGTAVTSDMYVHPEALGLNEIPDFGVEL